MVTSLVQKESHGGHRQKEYADVCRVMVEAITSHIFGNARQSLKHFVCDELEVKGYVLSTSRRRETVQERSKTATRVWVLLSVKKK